MTGFINGFDWVNVEPMRYWSFTASTPDSVKQETVKSAVFGGDYIGALKVDGYYQRIVKDEDGQLFMIARSRNVKGEVVDKHEWVPQLNEWFAALPNGTCFLCECYLPGMEGSKNITSVLGCLKEKAIARQKNNPLHLYVFDVMAFNGTNYDKTKYIDRAKALTMISKKEELHSPYVEWATFHEGRELWTALQTYLAAGREGMVIMRKDAIVYNKRTPARVSIKVKKELQQNIDCFFTGRTLPPTREYTGKEIETWQYWENTYTGEKMCGEFFKQYKNGEMIAPVTKGYYNGWAGSLEIGVLKQTKGKCKIRGEIIEGYNVVPIGWLSGVTEEMKADPKKFAFQPIEVTAMELYQDGTTITLRHGKLKQFRPDLDLTDCTWEKI